MFCKNCGKEIDEGTKTCPECGAPVSAAETVKEAAKETFASAEKELGSAISEVGDSLNGADKVPDGAGSGKLKTDRGLLSYIVLDIITCGIYGYYFIYKLAHDVNIACEGDGESTSGLLKFILLSIITCGIYSWYWDYKLGNRLSANAQRYGLTFQENGTSVLMWCIFGVLICGIGPFIAMNILIKNTNIICDAYNKEHGYV